MKITWHNGHTTAATIIALLIGFISIIALVVYSDHHTELLANQEVQAQRLLYSWSDVEAASRELLLSEDLVESRRRWETAVAEFDRGFADLAYSELSRTLSEDHPEFGNTIERTDKLWQFIKFRAVSLNRRLDDMFREEPGVNHIRQRSLLLKLGYEIGKGAPTTAQRKIYEITKDMCSQVASSGASVRASLDTINSAFSARIEVESSRVRVVSLVLSVLIIAVVIAFILQNQRILRDRERQYRTLQDNLPLGVFRTTPEGRFLAVNSAMVDMLGYDSEEDLMSIRAGDLYCVPDRREELKRILQSEEAGKDFEIQMRAKDGRIIWVSSNVHAIKNDHDEIMHFDGILEDITERKRAQEREQAAAIEKYKQAKRISGVFAHEIRNALFPATAALNKLKTNAMNGVPDVSDTEKYASIAARAVTNATGATRLISDFNKLETEVMPEQINFTEILTEVVNAHGPNMQELGIAVDLNGEPDIWIKSNRRQLPMVINNLVLNSIQALDGVDRPGIKICWRTTSDRLHVSFEDNGCGIPEDVMEKVFEPFFTTKTHDDGMGIGLSITRKIIEMYGGTVTVASHQGRGTRFELSFILCGSSPRVV